MKLQNIIISVIVILVLGFLVINKLHTSGDAAPEKGHGQAGMKKTPSLVDAYVVKTEKLDNRIFSSGTVTANNEVVLYSEISGKITHIYFQEGGRVTKGELLLKINDADLKAQLMKAKAAENLALETLHRDSLLLQHQGLSQQEYDQSHSMYLEAKADVDLLRAQIDKTEIRSPYNGRIGLKSVSEGSYLSPTVKIATIQELEPVKIDFSIPEKYMDMVKDGDEVKFTVQGAKDTFKANIYAIEPKIDIATRSLMVRAVCANRDDKVLPGAFAQVELILNQTPNALMVPTQAVIPVLKGEQVYIMKNGKAEVKPIKTGVRNDSTIQVTEGLEPGDTVITTGIMMLKPGMQVKVR